MNLTDQSLMPFGKYTGQKLINVPASYLLWLHREGKAGRVSEYISENLEVLQAQVKDEERQR